MRFRRSALLAVPFLLAGCSGGSTAPHQVIDPTSEPLRTRFDSDSGKVRALFLASPI